MVQSIPMTDDAPQSTSPTAPGKGAMRQRYLADRILVTLLFRTHDPEGGFTRQTSGHILLKLGPLASLLKMNSTKLYDQILFLHHAGYIQSVDPRYKWGHLRLLMTPPVGTRIESASITP